MGQGFVVVVLVGRYVASGLLCPRGLSGACLRRALRQLWSSFSSSSCRRLSLTAPLALYLVTRWLTLASSWEVELDFVAYASFVEFAYVVLFVHSGLLRLRSPAGSLATVVFSRFEPLAGEGLWQALLLLHLVARSPVLVALYGGCDGADRLRPCPRQAPPLLHPTPCRSSSSCAWSVGRLWFDLLLFGSLEHLGSLRQALRSPLACGTCGAVKVFSTSASSFLTVKG